jgi:DNA-binding NarL/FixJ family response regulator
MPKLLIVEPDKALLSTVASALHSKNYGIVGTAIESAAAIDYFGRVRADVLITEVDLNNGPMGTTGIDLALHLRSVFPMLGVVFLSSISDLSLVSAPPRLLDSSYFLPKSKITKVSMIELAIKESIRLIRSPETSSHDIYKINSRSKNKIDNICFSFSSKFNSTQFDKICLSHYKQYFIRIDRGCRCRTAKIKF